MRGGGRGWEEDGKAESESQDVAPSAAAFAAPLCSQPPRLLASVQIVVKIKVKQIILINI